MSTVLLASPSSARRCCSAAWGRACAKLLCPYPPGVPLLFPGELITAQALEALRATRAEGGAVVGASDASLQATVLVACRGDC